MESSTFGPWLAGQLVTHGYRSQRAFARAIDMDPTYLNRIINGHVQRPERETLERIAGGIGATFEEVAQRAGALPAEVMPPAVPAEEPTGDGPFDPAAIVAYVESYPDGKFQADLAEDAEYMSPEDYQDYCVNIWRMWGGNGHLAHRLAQTMRRRDRTPRP